MDDNTSARENQDTTLNDGIEYKFEKIVRLVENKVISTDGLTLAEVFRALVQILNNDLKLVKKVLVYANIMAKHGMKVAKESQLRRADVLQTLEDRENVIRRQGFIKKLPSTQSRPKIKVEVFRDE